MNVVLHQGDVLRDVRQHGSEIRPLAFGDLFQELAPAVRRIARKKAVRHPLLSEDDLFQEGLSALWRVWTIHCQSKPMEDLCKIGFRAVANRITSVRRRIFKRGEQLINWVDLDGSLDYTGSDGVREIIDGLFVREAIRAVDDTLSDIARAVLGEILEPGESTIRAVRKLWVNRAKMTTPWFRIEPLVYSSALGLPLPDVRKALREIRCEFVARLSPALDVGRYYKVGTNNQPLKGGTTMNHEKGFAPDPADFDLPGETPARPPTPGKTTETAAPGDSGKTPKSKGNAKKTPASRAKTAASPDRSGAKTSAKASGGVDKGKGKKVQPKPAKPVKAVGKAGDFRAGTKREKVWKTIQAKLSKKKTVKLEDFTAAFQATGKNERSARNSASLFSWKLIERGMIRRVGNGDFALGKK